MRKEAFFVNEKIKLLIMGYSKTIGNMIFGTHTQTSYKIVKEKGGETLSEKEWLVKSAFISTTTSTTVAEAIEKLRGMIEWIDPAILKIGGMGDKCPEKQRKGRMWHISGKSCNYPNYVRVFNEAKRTGIYKKFPLLTCLAFVGELITSNKVGSRGRGIIIPLHLKGKEYILHLYRKGNVCLALAMLEYTAEFAKMQVLYNGDGIICASRAHKKTPRAT